MQSSNLEEMYLLQLLSGGQFGGSSGWLSVAYLVCLFAVILFKPERVRNLSLFRRACTLFAISLIAPSLIAIATGALATASVSPFGSTPNVARVLSGGGGAGTYLVQLLWQILAAVGPLLFGISVLCALISIVPTFIPPPDVEPFHASREARPPYAPFGGPPTS